MAKAACLDAALAIARLDGALSLAPQRAQSIFASALLRRIITAALHQEGHAFAESRFNAWFAGLTTLTDEPAHTARPPKVVCEAILTELTHSTWGPLATAATQLRDALLAPHDHSDDDAHQDVHFVIKEARQLVRENTAHRSPFTALASLRAAMLEHPAFTPSETASPLSLSGEARLLVSPLWAVDIFAGECLSAAGWLRPSLLLTGLIRREMLCPSDPASADTMQANALEEAASHLNRQLLEAVHAEETIRRRLVDRRSTSRAPALLATLAGFGAMRSSQIERVLRLTRLGARTILRSLESDGLVERRTLAGAHLYSPTLQPSTFRDYVSPPLPSLTSAALDAFDVSLAEIDRLLGRSSVEEDD